MNAFALRLGPDKTLRIAVVSTDDSRRLLLGKLIVDAGHLSVDVPHQADVVLADGDTPVTGIATIVIGGDDDSHAHAGSLPPDATPEQIDAAIRAVAAGLIVRRERERQSGFGELRQRATRVLLTPRELDMLSAIGAGLSNKAIARRFDISLHTVKFHVESLFRKLGARSRAEAVAKGLEGRVNETIEL